MKTAKITEIWNINEWKWPHGMVYYINLKLDNLEAISLGKTKKDAFKVGDTVNYEDYTDANGKQKQREVRENNFVPNKKSYGDNNKWAFIWMAMKIAFDKVYEKEEDFQKATYLAQRIYDVAMDMYNGSKSENKTESNKSDGESQELPL